MRLFKIFARAAALSILGFVMLAAGLAIAQDPTVIIPETQTLMELVTFLGGLKGMSAMAVAAGATQVVMHLLQGTFAAAKVPGKIRLLTVCALAVVFSVLAKMAVGAPFLEALLSGGTVAVLSVFFHQLQKQLFEKSPPA